MKFNLDRNGYITKYLYSGIKEIEFFDDSSDNNQLRYEKYLRSIIANHIDLQPQRDIRLGAPSQLGMPWNYYYSYGNVFLDRSEFYADMKRIELHASTILVVEEDMEITTWLWSYAAIDLWVNEELAGRIDKPIYKPINRTEVKIKLKKGMNQLFIRLVTLGVRDTKISFAIQIKERQDEISMMLPDKEAVKPYVKAEELLNSAVLEKDKIIFSEKLPEGSFISYDTENPDFRKLHEKYRKEDISGLSEITLKEYASFCINIKLHTTLMKRQFERIDLRTSNYLKSTEINDPTIRYKKIAVISSLTRSQTDGFALYPILARYYLGINKDSDLDEIMVTLGQIERRMDCSDFMTCGLIRFIKNYEITDEIKCEIKRVMLNFRYWMDEEGQDGMCFWSENHSLMFYQTAYFFGQEYYDDIFIRSGKNGKEMYELAKSRLLEWLNDICLQGFDEFNSGVYSPITFAALLNIVDYGEEELSKLATQAADLLMLGIARHCFKSVMISPQGRVYRDVLYPHLQALQSIVNYVIKEVPYVNSEWLISLATSNYIIPKEFLTVMNQKGHITYQSSNAVIDLYKTDDYILTSVQSPRKDGLKRIWESNLMEVNRDEYIYTKSLNECFHGTMQFEPGVFGYQQHLWYAALDPELAVFINHPGETCEASKARPGYWHGNGITPALTQIKNILGIIYVIPDTHPVGFTHMFWNTKKFDEVTEKGNWHFGRKGNGYIGVWCSTSMVDYNDVIFECEKRAYDDKVAYLCVCGSQEENGNYEDFVESCFRREIQFSKDTDTLTCSEFHMTFKQHINDTQYVE
jgi:hypothetical protein